MNFVQIECFLCVATLRNFTKASEKLYLSQPTISRNISYLENELNCKLLERTTQKVELTDAGHQYCHMFLSWKMQLDSIKNHVWRLSKIERCKIKLGFLEGWVLPTSMMEFLEIFPKNYPEIEIELICLGIRELMEDLAKGLLDFALVIDNPGFQKYDFSFKQITIFNKVILYSLLHPLSRKHNLIPQDFRNETFLILDEEYEYVLERTREYCSVYNFEPKTTKVRNIQTILTNVQSGTGVTINDEWGPGCYRDYFSMIPIQAKRSVYLVWKKERRNKAMDTIINEFHI